MFDRIGVVVSDREQGWRCYEHILAPLGSAFLIDPDGDNVEAGVYLSPAASAG
jgi:hypothetical protein